MRWRVTTAITSVTLVIFISALLQACGGKHGGISDTNIPALNLGTCALENTIAEINAAETPTGVDADVYEGLKAELIRVIEEAADKGVSIPPSGEQNEVTSLTLLGNDTEGWRLEWCYVNVGDYDFNSEVNIADLTPIGMHLGATSVDENWLEACCADGDGNSEVNIADVTPIGQNYQATVAGFKVYGADSPDGPWQEIDTADIPDPPFDPAVPFNYNLEARDYDYYRVVPVDGANAEGTPSWASMATLTTPEVALGEDQPAESASIGAEGGTLTGADVGNGPVTLQIPAGELTEAFEFEIGYNDGSVTRDGEELDAQLIYVTASDYVRFENPAKLTIPLPDEENSLVVAFRVLHDGGLAPLGMPEIDHNAGTATFDLKIAFPGNVDHQTSGPFDFPAYRWQICYMTFVITTAVQGEAAKHSFKTDFSPDKDGFLVSGMYPAGSDWFSSTFGIGPFCCWYYHNYRPSMGPLSTKFPDLDVQRRIIHRAWMSTFIGVGPNPIVYDAITDASKEECFEIIKAALRNSNGPVFVLKIQDDKGNARFKVAYGYSYEKLIVYEPDKPSQQHKCDALESGHKVFLVGTDDFPMYEPYENILLDATADPPFGGSGNATITVTSHSSGDTVDGYSAKLAGYITSGDYLVEELYVFNTRFPLETHAFTAVPLSGDFQVEVPLQSGPNILLFFTRAQVRDVDSRYKLYLVSVHNNLGDGQFWLEGAGTPPTGMGVIKGVVTDSYYLNGMWYVDVIFRDETGTIEIDRTTTDNWGAYEHELPPGVYTVEYSRDFWEPVEREYPINEGEITWANVALEPLKAKRIYGHVWDMNNAWNEPDKWKPLGGVEVTWTHSHGSSWEGMPPPPQYTVTTDASGAYSVAPAAGLRLPGTWRFRAIKEGYHEDYLNKCSLPAPDLKALHWTGIQLSGYVGENPWIHEEYELDLLLQKDY